MTEVQEAMDYLLNQLNPERAIVAIGREGRVHGLPTKGLWLTAPISHTILRGTLESGQPFNAIDAAQHPSLKERTSVMLAEIRSVICLPVNNPVGMPVGLLYADSRVKARAFEEEDFNLVTSFARQLSTRLGTLNLPPLDWDGLQQVRFT
ncbi:MAG: GAF domain-containing protein [Candidatus Eremiobacterota bacterium]